MTTSPDIEEITRLRTWGQFIEQAASRGENVFTVEPDALIDFAAAIRTAVLLLEEAKRVVEPFAALDLPEDETGTPDDKIGQQKPLPYPVRQDAIRAGRAFLEKLGSET